MPVPQTVDEAIADGYEVKLLSPEEAERVMKGGGFNLELNGTLTPHGTRNREAASPRDCATIPRNSICWEGDCVAGYKEVLYCDGAQGCTLYTQIKC